MVDHAHNDYIELLTDLGLVGVGFVFWFWLSMFRAVIPALKRRRSKFARLAAIGALSGLSAILMHSVTDFNLAIPANALYLFLLFSILVSASHSSRQGKSSELPELSTTWKRSLSVILSLSTLLIVLFSGGEFVAKRIFSTTDSMDLAVAGDDQLRQYDAIVLAAEKFSPLNATYPFIRATTTFSLGHFDNSLNHLKKSLYLKPFESQPLLQAARTFYVKDDINKAEIVLKGALNAASMNWDANSDLADFLIAQGRLEEGLKVFKSGLLLRPEQTPIVLQHLVLQGVKRNMMMNVLPEISLPWSVYADFMQEMGDLGVAEQAYRRGIQYVHNDNPPNTRIFWRYLKFLGDSKRNAEALGLLTSALKLFPQNKHFLARQGVIYESEGLRDLAIESFRSSLLIDPRQDWVRKRLEKLQGR